MTKGGTRAICDLETLYLVYQSYAKFTPSEFNRKPRLLSDFRLFKATEFHTFGLYTEHIFLKRYLTEDGYYSFLLSLAYRIITSTIDKHHLAKAQGMLEYFVESFSHFLRGFRWVITFTTCST